MRATEQTAVMLQWWATAGLDRADLAVRRPSGSMIWHHDLALDALPLAWARAENARHAEIYIRPTRGHAWPVVFLDDVAVDRAYDVARETDALIIQTSPAGGCHLWLRCDHALAERDRARGQRLWVPTLGADPASVSGEHLGRLAGFKNWKRGGCWVNVLAATHRGCSWPAAAALTQMPTVPTTLTRPHRRGGGRDATPSGHDWGWVCTQLERGRPADTIYAHLVERARPRRGADAERYARRTVDHALRHIACARRVAATPPRDRER